MVQNGERGNGERAGAWWTWASGAALDRDSGRLAAALCTASRGHTAVAHCDKICDTRQRKREIIVLYHRLSAMRHAALHSAAHA
jgi:hypothetical protein